MISVAICTFNGSKYIYQQLESIINQTRQPDEIVLCDDCSSDDTVEIAKQILTTWRGKSYLIRNKENLGFQKNFEKCISICSGDIVFLSDQDDIWSYRKIEVMSAVFYKNPNVVMVFHDVSLINNNLEIIYPSFWKILDFNFEKFVRKDYRVLFRYNVVQGSACAFRKKVFFEAYPFPEEAIHDEWLALVAVTEGDLFPVQENLMKYRQADNVIGGVPLSLCKKIKKWLGQLGCSFMEHFNETWRRKKIFEIYCLRYGYKSNDNIFVELSEQYLSFLKMRLLGIRNNKKILFNMLSTYFYYYSMKNALKFFIKDVFYKRML